jgi:hypothetical protein
MSSVDLALFKQRNGKKVANRPDEGLFQTAQLHRTVLAQQKSSLFYRFLENYGYILK